MLGAIIGDIVGSRFERHNHQSKDFELFTDQCRFTDDTAMTVAIAKALLECNGDYTDLSNHAIRCMQEIGQKYPDAGYGRIFYQWLHKKAPEPYWSYGNGSAMRVSPVAYVAKSAKECIELADAVTRISHDHPEGMKGAEAIASMTLGARSSLPKSLLRDVAQKRYYILDFTIDKIRPKYRFDASCQGSVPQAIEAFLESEDFEDAIRIAVSLGGDSDTIAAMTGSLAGAYYGVPNELRKRALTYLPRDFLDILEEFEATYQK
jgi:type I restriction enzyme M protein